MSYFKLDKERVVYLDIDDSIILWDINKYEALGEVIDLGNEGTYFPVIPHHRNIEFVKKLKTQGYGIVAWSAAGANWASKVIDKLGLQELPDLIISKPELAVDDLLDAKRIIKSVIWLDPETGEFKRNE